MTTISSPPPDPFAPDASNPFGVKPLGAELTDIENGFWTSTPELAYICAIAHKRGVGRWALLGSVLANLLSWLPPYVVMCDSDGSTESVSTAGSLNFFAHLVDDSGEGKSRLMGVANEVIAPNVSRYGHAADEADLLGSGTGEGLCKHFVGLGRLTSDEGEKNPPKVMIQKTDVAVLEVDEVSTYIGELERATSKAAGILTSLWSGQTTGSNTGGEDSRTKVPRHAARVVVKLLAQPGLCSRLFTDDLIAGGTPQRPLWLPGSDFSPCPVTQVPTDPSFRRPRPPRGAHAVYLSRSGMTASINAPEPELDFPRPAAPPSSLVWISHTPKMASDLSADTAQRAADKLSPAQKVALSPAEREARKGESVRRHSTFTRIKVSVALALLHGRLEFQPTDVDWELSGVVARVNLGMLSYLWTEGAIYRREQAVKRGRERADERTAEFEALDDKEETDIKAVCMDIWQQMMRKGPMTSTSLRRGKSTRRQKMMSKVTDYGVNEGLLVYEPDTHLYFPVFNGSVVDARIYPKSKAV